MDNINKEFANKTFDVKCLDQARKALILIQNNYSDIEEISIPDLEMFIEKANNYICFVIIIITYFDINIINH